MKRIIYIGNAIHILEALDIVKEIQVIANICEEIGYIEDAPVKQYVVKDNKDLGSVISAISGMADYALMYNFGIIINAELIKKMLIYNFHPGFLNDNRGSSPINWSILLNQKVTAMTFYEISDKIDLGKILSEHTCRIYDSDVPDTLRLRLEAEIPSMVMEFISGNCVSRSIEAGKYRPRITERDYTIEDIDSKLTIMAKIRSQYGYKGAVYFVNGEKCYVRSYNEYLNYKNGDTE